MQRRVMVEQFIILHPFGAGEDIVPLGRLPVRLDQPCVQHRSGFQVFPRIGPGHRQAAARIADACGQTPDILARMKRFGFLRSEEHTSELQSLMRISYAVFCLKKKKTDNITKHKVNTTKKAYSQKSI